MDINEKLPESALFDHRLVKAPYLRYAGIIKINENDKIYKYDLRLVQPNTDMVPIQILHSLEHLLAVVIRRHISNIIDISPMGCLTGFYITTINQPYKTLSIALENSFKDVLNYDNVPFSNEIQCGAAKNHDLIGAKKYAKLMLDNRENWEIGAKNAMNETNSIELH